MLKGGGQACRDCSIVQQRKFGDSWTENCYPEFGCPKPRLMPANELFVTLYLPMVNCRSGDSFDYRTFIEYMRLHGLEGNELLDCIAKAVTVESVVITEILKEKLKTRKSSK